MIIIINALIPFIVTIIIIVTTILMINKNRNNKSAEKTFIGEGIGLGLIFGAAISIIFHIGNIGLGASIGMLIGIIIGMNIRKK